jgi:hypothetical protein
MTTLWSKFKLKINGWKTIIWSRFLVLLGVAVTLLAALDPGAITALIPAQYQPFAPLLIVGIGLVTEWLRHLTVAPVGVKVETTTVDPGPPTTTSTSDNA